MKHTPGKGQTPETGLQKSNSSAGGFRKQARGSEISHPTPTRGTVAESKARRGSAKFYTYDPRFTAFYELELSGNYTAALSEYEKIVGTTNSETTRGRAFYRIGLLYKDGLGVKKDLLKAARFFELASERDSSDASLELVDLYRTNKDIFKGENYSSLIKDLLDNAPNQTPERITENDLEQNIAEKNFKVLYKKLSSYSLESKDDSPSDRQFHFMLLALCNANGIGTAVNGDESKNYYNKISIKEDETSQVGNYILYTQYLERERNLVSLNIAKEKIEVEEKKLKNLETALNGLAQKNTSKKPTTDQAEAFRKEREPIEAKKKELQIAYDKIGGDSMHKMLSGEITQRKALLDKEVAAGNFPPYDNKFGIIGYFELELSRIKGGNYNKTINDLLIEIIKTIKEKAEKPNFEDFPEDIIGVIGKIKSEYQSPLFAKINDLQKQYFKRQDENYNTIKNRDTFTDRNLATIKEHDARMQNDALYAAHFNLRQAYENGVSLIVKTELLNHSLDNFKKYLLEQTLELRKKESLLKDGNKSKDEIAKIRSEIHDIYRNLEKTEQRITGLNSQIEKSKTRKPEQEEKRRSSQLSEKEIAFAAVKAKANEILGAKEQEFVEHLGNYQIYQRAKQAIFLEAKKEFEEVAKAKAKAKAEAEVKTEAQTEEEVKVEPGKERKSMDSAIPIAIINKNYAYDLELAIVKHSLSSEQEKTIAANPELIKSPEIQKILAIQADCLYELALCYKNGTGGVDKNTEKYQNLLIQSLVCSTPKDEQPALIARLKTELQNASQKILEANFAKLADAAEKGTEISINYSDYIDDIDIKGLFIKNSKIDLEAKDIGNFTKIAGKTQTAEEIQSRAKELETINSELTSRKADLARFQAGKLAALDSSTLALTNKESKEQARVEPYQDFVTQLFSNEAYKENPYYNYVRYQRLVPYYFATENILFLEEAANFKRNFDSQRPEDNVKAAQKIFDLCIKLSAGGSSASGIDQSNSSTINISADLLKRLQCILIKAADTDGEKRKEYEKEEQNAKATGAKFFVDKNFFDSSCAEIIQLLNTNELKITDQNGNTFSSDIHPDKVLAPERKRALDGISPEVIEAAKALDKAINEHAPLEKIEALREKFLELNIRNLTEESTKKIADKKPYLQQLIRFINNLEDGSTKVSDIFNEDGNRGFYYQAKGIIDPEEKDAGNKAPLGTYAALCLFETIVKLSNTDDYKRLIQPLDGFVARRKQIDSLKKGDPKIEELTTKLYQDVARFFQYNSETFFFDLSRHLKEDKNSPVKFVTAEERIESSKTQITERVELCKKTPEEIFVELNRYVTLNQVNDDPNLRNTENRLNLLLKGAGVDEKLIANYVAKLREINDINRAIDVGFKGQGNAADELARVTNQINQSVLAEESSNVLNERLVEDPPAIADYKNLRAGSQKESLPLINSIMAAIDPAKLEKINRERQELSHILKENLHKLEDGDVNKRLFKDQYGNLSKKPGDGYKEIAINNAYIEELIAKNAPDLLEGYRDSLASYRKEQNEDNKFKYEEHARVFYAKSLEKLQNRLQELRANKPANLADHQINATPEEIERNKIKALMIIIGRLETNAGEIMALDKDANSEKLLEVAKLCEKAGLTEDAAQFVSYAQMLKNGTTSVETKEKSSAEGTSPPLPTQEPFELDDPLPPPPPLGVAGTWDPQNKQLENLKPAAPPPPALEPVAPPPLKHVAPPPLESVAPPPPPRRPSPPRLKPSAKQETKETTIEIGTPEEFSLQAPRKRSENVTPTPTSAAVTSSNPVRPARGKSPSPKQQTTETKNDQAAKPTTIGDKLKKFGSLHAAPKTPAPPPPVQAGTGTQTTTTPTTNPHPQGQAPIVDPKGKDDRSAT